MGSMSYLFINSMIEKLDFTLFGCYRINLHNQIDSLKDKENHYDLHSFSDWDLIQMNPTLHKDMTMIRNI